MKEVNYYTYDEIAVGQSARLSKKVTFELINEFAKMTGDTNLLHIDKEFAEHSRFKKIIAHGLIAASFISAVLGTLLPGPGTIYLEQSLKFLKPVFPDDTITAEVIVEAKEARSILLMRCNCYNQNNELVLTGNAKIMAPAPK